MEAMLKGAQKSFELRNTLVKIGRSKENQCMLDTSEVSWFHAQIRLQGQLYYVVDLNSSNGTYVNEYKLLPNVSHPLSDGDVVRFGNLAFYYITNPSQKMLTKRSPISSNITHNKKKKSLNWITFAGGLASLATVFVAIWSVFTYLQPASVPTPTPIPGSSIAHLRSSYSGSFTRVDGRMNSLTISSLIEDANGHFTAIERDGDCPGEIQGAVYLNNTVNFSVKEAQIMNCGLVGEFQGLVFPDGHLAGTWQGAVSQSSGSWTVD